MLNKPPPSLRFSLSLVSQSLVDNNDLDTARVERVGLSDDLVVSDVRSRQSISDSDTGTLQWQSKGLCTLPGLQLIPDDLVGACDHDDVTGTEGHTSDLGARKIAVGDVTGLGDGCDRGQVVVDGRSKSAAELGLLSGILLLQDGAVDVVPRGLALDVGNKANLSKSTRTKQRVQKFLVWC